MRIPRYKYIWIFDLRLQVKDGCLAKILNEEESVRTGLETFWPDHASLDRVTVGIGEKCFPHPADL